MGGGFYQGRTRTCTDRHGPPSAPSVSVRVRPRSSVLCPQKKKAARESGLRGFRRRREPALAGSLGALPLFETAVERLLDQLLGFPFADPLDVGDFADDEVLGALEHLFFTEGEALALGDESEVL